MHKRNDDRTGIDKIFTEKELKELRGKGGWTLKWLFFVGLFIYGMYECHFYYYSFPSIDSFYALIKIGIIVILLALFGQGNGKFPPPPGSKFFVKIFKSLWRRVY